MTVTRPSRDGELGTSPLMDYVFEHAQRWPDKSAVTDSATTVTRTYRAQTAAARRTAAGLATHGGAKATAAGVTPVPGCSRGILRRPPSSTPMTSIPVNGIVVR